MTEVTNAPSAVRVSVVICAYTEERWDVLVAALESVRSQSQRVDEIVLVIDHNPHLLERARESFPYATVVENTETRGLSGARNSGIAASHGELIAFVDDDALLETDWLKKLHPSLQNPDVIGVGGRIIPKWEAIRPEWMPEEFYWVVGCSHRGLAETTADVRNLVGANMLIRRSAFDQVGGFRSEIGRVGTIPLGCEETEFCIRTRQHIPNARFVYEPDALVFHHVPMKRGGWAYFQSRCYAEGISKAVVSRMVGRQDGLSAERTHAFKTLPKGIAQGVKDSYAQSNRWGLARAGAIAAGLAITTAGYARGMMSKPVVKTSLVKQAPSVTSDGETPLRILMVAARYYPLVGGTETHIYEVARRLAAGGHQVTILTTNPGHQLPAEEQVDGVTILRVKAFPVQRDYYFAPELYSIIQKGHWDVIHCQGYHTLFAPLAMFAAIRARIPFVLTFHSGGHSSRFRTMARGIQRLLLKPLLSHAAQLIGVSQFEANFFASNLNFSPDRFTIVPNGSHLPSISPVPKKPDEILIVSPGRLEEYKGHQRVLEAMPEILKRHPNAKLRIVGTGPYENELWMLAERLGIKNRIEIGGIPAQNRQGMAELLSQASLVTLLSEYEAHPLGVMEALSLGCSVLVADTSGLSELAQKGWVKAIPLSSTPQQVATAMLRQLDEPVAPAEIKLPTWDDCAAQLAAIYRRVVKTPQVLPQA